MSLVIDSLRGVAGLLKYASRTFVLALIAVDGIYGLLLAGVVLWISAAGTSPLRFVLATIVTVSLVLVLGFAVAFQFTLARTIAWGVEQAALGRRVCDALFEITLGETEESASVPSVTLGELQAKLNAAGETLLSQKAVIANSPRMMLWLLSQIQRALVWATVRVILRYCMSYGTEELIDQVEIHQRLSSIIDIKVADYLKEHALRSITAIFFGVTFLAILIALWIRCIPW
ncbi:MAG: hypothetical protein ACIAZJ_01325 [Gimesia chilikensis]|uniref:hypothetical protein n=1 Tax=Gimesia chilikensis TaxID=2605989 RepID=UPI00379A7D9E